MQTNVKLFIRLQKNKQKALIKLIFNVGILTLLQRVKQGTNNLVSAFFQLADDTQGFALICLQKAC